MPVCNPRTVGQTGQSQDLTGQWAYTKGEPPIQWETWFEMNKENCDAER